MLSKPHNKLMVIKQTNFKNHLESRSLTLSTGVCSSVRHQRKTESFLHFQAVYIP